MATRSATVTSTVVVSDERDEVFTVDVEVKVAGVDLNELSSDRKVFTINGREHPMSRFGSWSFQEGVVEHIRKICIDGGIIPSLTWGLQQICPQVDVWVKDMSRCRFSLIMKSKERTSVLRKVAGGAKDLQSVLREKIPEIYRNIRIILIKILKSPNESSKSGANADASGVEYLSRSSILRDFERISNLIETNNYGIAYAQLKQMMERKVTDTERVQILIRLGICCCHLQKPDEIQDNVVRILSITEKMEDCASPMDMFMEDIAMLAEKLGEAGMFVYGLDTILACNKMFRKIEDPDDILDKLLFNIMICCAFMKNALYRPTTPMVRVKDEIRKCVEKLNEEVEQIKNLKGCDPLGQSRAVYYSLHMLNGMNDHLGEPISKASNMGPSSTRFACIASAWADFTNVLSLGDRHPEIALMLRDRSFTKMVKEISDNPLLLEKRIMDPRIVQINAILNKNLFKATPMTPFTGVGFGDFELEMFQQILGQTPGFSGVVDKKRKSQLEKEKGNEAYKKKQYDKALGHYDKAIELDPSDALLHNNKAAVFISKGELPKARESCLTALRVTQARDSTENDKDVAKILARMARVEFLCRRYEESMALYQKSLRLHDDEKVREQMQECGDAIITRNVLAGFAMF